MLAWTNNVFSRDWGNGHENRILTDNFDNCPPNKNIDNETDDKLIDRGD